MSISGAKSNASSAQTYARLAENESNDPAIQNLAKAVRYLADAVGEIARVMK